MTTAYTSLLGLALPVTGELSGTWGDTVNDYITQYLDASVAGTQTISGSQTAVTLSKTTNASLSQAGSGATGSSQYNVINCTGNPASMLTVTVPAASKTYVVVNATSTNQDVKIVGAGPTTGVTLVAGERAIIAWNGSDFIKVATSTADGVTTLSFGSTGLTPSSATSGAVTVAGTLVAANGGTGQSSYTTGDLLYATGSTALSKLGIGTNGQILTSTGTAPQWSTLSGVAVTTFSAGTTGFTPSSATSGAITLAGTLATTNGGTGLTSFTANGVVYASSTSALTTGSALTFDGTTQTITAAYGAESLRLQRSGVAGQYSSLRYGSAAGNYGFTFDSVDTSAADPSFMWRTSIDGSTLSERMRLTSTGLGIGTSSPAYKLDVVGTIQSRGTHGAGSFNAFIIKNTASSQGSGKISWRGSTDNETWAIAQDQTVGAGNLEFNYLGSNKAVFDSSGNLGLGVTPSAFTSTIKALQIGPTSVFRAGDTGYTQATFVSSNARQASAVDYYIANGYASQYGQQGGAHYWYTAASGTAGNTISFTQAMTLDASGNLGVGTTSPGNGFEVAVGSKASAGVLVTGNNSPRIAITETTGSVTASLALDAAGSYLGTVTNHPQVFRTNGTERARITAEGFTRPVAYADTVSALGNTGTAKTIDLQTANVFTATLTGNCTFTLSNPIATGSSSFTLILTNDGTAGRTVAWAGGSFVFPGGAASLSRTTTANAVDVWVFFTPNGGTTWYGNIAMKNMTA